MKKELENLSEADEKVQKMLASLRQVEAPKDFEFRLKARIAGANPKAYRANYKRRFAYALPAFASIVVSTFVVLNMDLSGDRNRVSSLPETTAQSNFAPPQNPPGNFIAANTSVDNEPGAVLSADSSAQNRKDEKVNPTFTAVKLPEKRKNTARDEAPKENFDGSKVESWSPTEVRTPKGINANTNTNVAPPKDFNSEKSFSVEELLSPLGVEVVAENGTWKVKKVSQNSAAERSGLKTDDVIETLDGRKLSPMPLRGKKIEVKKLGVKRAGAQIEINLQTAPK
ncbi:MAG TPA: PDZ domain-containing protein [Pyrinomonadaceae bacterium]|jgi:hypothetical protein